MGHHFALQGVGVATMFPQVANFSETKAIALAGDMITLRQTRKADANEDQGLEKNENKQDDNKDDNMDNNDDRKDEKKQDKNNTNNQDDNKDDNMDDNDDKKDEKKQDNNNTKNNNAGLKRRGEELDESDRLEKCGGSGASSSKNGQIDEGDSGKAKRKMMGEEIDEKKTLKFLRKLERREQREGRKRVREGDQDEGRIEEVAQADEMAVNELRILEIDEDVEIDAELDEGELDPKQVVEGRREEAQFMVKRLDMFEFGSYEEAVGRGGKVPTTTKWVEGWKMGEDGKRFVRCRLVGRDFKARSGGDMEDLFAAMPPLEAKKMMFRMVAGGRRRRLQAGKDEIKLMFIDVRKAHLNAVCDEEEWVELPEEMWEWGKYATLRRWLYGMRKAAAGWEADYAGRLGAIGFRRGRGAPTLFVNLVTGVRVVVHGDDFTCSGRRKELEAVRQKMREWYDIKDRGIMGSSVNEIKEVTILGRTVRWTAEGIEYEADEKHRKELLKEEGLVEQSKAVVGPSVKEKTDMDDDETDLGREEARKFRGSAARLNYLGQDRPDIQFATKEICQGMSRPTVGGLRKIKRAVRYLVGARRLVWKYGDMEGGAVDAMIDIYVDSDWAGSKDRRSTRGGVAAVGGVAIKHWSRTQKSRALSSTEAEYYALVTGAAEGLGIRSLAEDLGWVMAVRLWTDSSGAKGAAARRGLGKLRHVELKYLWVQQAAKEGRVELRKIKGEQNPADHLTKPKTKLEMAERLEEVGGTLE